ncbi:protein pleiotropic regulatory locus 1-like [Pyrus x bretschneideri]|uniref:protein pleiotropic regulatory locus 1-like n=1 Tax=Pyrus x bretschneideri TaxID=225117 RepID=UPI00202E5E0C|nr:protein pleiotropic regulatory locus 1-like [Pyrus x bretschneideri]
MESSLGKLISKSLKRPGDLFFPTHGSELGPPDLQTKKIRMTSKASIEYGGLKPTADRQNPAADHDESSNALPLDPNPTTARSHSSTQGDQNADLFLSPSATPKAKAPINISDATPVLYAPGSSRSRDQRCSTTTLDLARNWPSPVWHSPWKIYRVISGHLGWVRSVAFDPSNRWVCTGSADRTIKIWDVASGTLQLSLTGHIGQIRSLAVSSRQPYLFSAGDDKQVKCWDLEQNKVIRSYHGHLSGVYSMALHPTLDVLVTGGRDSVCRVWDVRLKNVQVHALTGHEDTVCSLLTRPMDPQVISGSHDTTVKLWDLRKGKTFSTLTHHKKSVRALTHHPKLDRGNCFASASTNTIKKFNLPRGEFLHNMLSQQKSIINAMAVNEDGVMATGGDNGSLWFWDWKSGHSFQQSQTIAQPGSLESEAGIYALCYDVTGTRLVTCEADKTIKMWKQDEKATPETHPLNFRPPNLRDVGRF